MVSKSLPNWSSPNKTTFQKETWFTAPSDGWVHYAQETPSNTYKRYDIKDSDGNIVLYGTCGRTMNTKGHHTVHMFLPKDYSIYVYTDTITTYDSVNETFSTTQGAFFIPAYQ